jgi:nucleotide-binding universal stress UspA family protein
MYKKILVAIDGSSVSDGALHAAFDLAKSMGATVRIVHVVDEATFNWESEFVNPSEIWSAMAKSGQSLLEKAAAAGADAKISVETRLIEITSLGLRIPEVIQEEAATWPADLIVVGTHGRRGLNHLLLGSVAEGIVRVSTKPVLLIRGK